MHSWTIQQYQIRPVFSGVTNHSVSIIIWSKKQLINAEIKGKELQKNLSVLELKNQVRTYYYQILYLQHNQKQLQELDSLYNNFIRHCPGFVTKLSDTKKWTSVQRKLRKAKSICY